MDRIATITSSSSHIPKLNSGSPPPPAIESLTLIMKSAGYVSFMKHFMLITPFQKKKLNGMCSAPLATPHSVPSGFMFFSIPFQSSLKRFLRVLVYKRSPNSIYLSMRLITYLIAACLIYSTFSKRFCMKRSFLHRKKRRQPSKADIFVLTIPHRYLQNAWYMAKFTCLFISAFFVPLTITEVILGSFSSP